jgi:hypothetical protein
MLAMIPVVIVISLIGNIDSNSARVLTFDWVAAQFDLPEDRVREYVKSLRTRAEQQRAEDGD